MFLSRLAYIEYKPSDDHSLVFSRRAQGLADMDGSRIANNYEKYIRNIADECIKGYGDSVILQLRNSMSKLELASIKASGSFDTGVTLGIIVVELKVGNYFDLFSSRSASQVKVIIR